MTTDANDSNGGSSAAAPLPPEGDLAAEAQPAPGPAASTMQAALAAPTLRPDPDNAGALERDLLLHPDLALAVLALFLVASAAKMQLFVIESDGVRQRFSGLASASLEVVTALWFIRCFTGDGQRRIPEFQRRMHLRDVATDKERKLQAFQARACVVFQIMQLVSARFLAVATWFIVGPASLTSAAMLAFRTGFASEPLLLMIRGWVEGIRPGSSVTKPAAPEASPGLKPAPEPPAEGVVEPGAQKTNG